MKYKIAGLALIALSIISALVFIACGETDGTGAVFIGIIGLLALFYKED